MTKTNITVLCSSPSRIWKLCSSTAYMILPTPKDGSITWGSTSRTEGAKENSNKSLKQGRLVTQHGSCLRRYLFAKRRPIANRVDYLRHLPWISLWYRLISRIMDFSILNSLESIVMVTSLGKSKEKSSLKIMKKIEKRFFLKLVSIHHSVYNVWQRTYYTYCLVPSRN